MKIVVFAVALFATPAFGAGYCTTTPDGKARIPKTAGKTCPSGYFSTGDCCEAFHRNTPAAIQKIPGKACPSGTYASGGSCASFR